MKNQAFPTSSDLVADLAVTAHGSSGPTVVLVHGSAPANCWGELPARLASSHRVITYARRSFSPSTAPLPSSIDDHVDDLVEIITGFGGRATIVGWSMGGVISLALATRRPELVNGLLLIEAPVHFDQSPPPSMLEAVGAAFAALPTSPPEAARHFLRWAMQRADGSTDIDRFDDAAIDESAQALLGDLRLGAHNDGGVLGSAALDTSKAAVIWLLGGDGCAPFADAAHRSRLADNAIDVLTVPGAGHAIHLDRPDFVAHCVRSLSPESPRPPSEPQRMAGDTSVGGGLR
ncbi:pimeloyl-ACP methyl ester carboxylesterase [Mycobacterium sp. MAA66]|uniref:alpha/beta fold hydrolase n=1 Tax=Mycobacterium sp. MAA66 TaxID=3156297 RepID=UPI00351811E0